MSPQRNLIAARLAFRNEVQGEGGEYGVGKDWTKSRMMQHSPCCGSVTNFNSMRWRTFLPLRKIPDDVHLVQAYEVSSSRRSGKTTAKIDLQASHGFGDLPRYEMRVSGRPDAWSDEHRLL